MSAQETANKRWEAERLARLRRRTDKAARAELIMWLIAYAHVMLPKELKQ